MFSGRPCSSGTVKLYKNLASRTCQGSWPTSARLYTSIRQRRVIPSQPHESGLFLAPHLYKPASVTVTSATRSSPIASGGMARRNVHSSPEAKGSKEEQEGSPQNERDRGHHRLEENGHDENHEHGHSHSIFSAHSHSRDDGHSVQGVATIVNALEGNRDRGSRITLIGLVVNVGLTASKGAAGWYMNSAALLAEAGHSASDLLGDLVTLLCWKLSRKPPSEKYPYGYGKFETIGTSLVSIILIGGALGIGFHSYNLLIHSLVDTASSLPPGPAQAILQNVTEVAQNVGGAVASIGLDHAHAHALDPNAAWFAGLSVIAKEWLYRATKKVADEEGGSVLLANAIHHRSDAYSSFVALVAILGTWWFPALPLDQLGGLVVSVVILQQGFSLLSGAFGELTDAGVSPKTRRTLQRALDPLVASSLSSNAEASLLAIRDLRAMRSGALMFVDLTAHVPKDLSVRDASMLEEKIRVSLTEAKKEIYEVRVKFRTVGTNDSLH